MSDTYALPDLAAIQEKWWTPGPGSSAAIAPEGFQSVGYISEFANGGPVIEPTPPNRCPHCNRDWHTEPLTRRVADMVRSHKFDPTYKRAEDDSVVECVGSDVCGPNRDYSPAGRQFGIGINPNPGAAWFTYMDEAYVMATSYMQDMVTLVTGLQFPEWEIPSYSYMFESWFPDKPKFQCPELPEIAVEFGPEHWPVEHVIALFPPHLEAVAQVHPNEWRETTPLPKSPDRDFSAIVEDFNKQYPTYPKGKTHEGI